MQTGTLFCFGLGYSARALARTLRDAGWTVRGTTRSAEKVARLAAEGFEMHLFDTDVPLGEPHDALRDVTHLLVSISPEDAGDPVLRAHAAELRALTTLRWAGYLSTTAVYGDAGGGWVDETSPLKPVQPRAVRRADAERAWLDSGLPVEVFRLAGIYGPGRSPLEKASRPDARRIVKPGQVFSRIHVEDIAGTLMASMAHPRPGNVWNVCDDEPAPPQDVIGYAAELLGVDPPPEVAYEDAELSPMARSFYADNRRVRNRRLRQELGYCLRYPTYREGLQALAEA